MEGARLISTPFSSSLTRRRRLRASFISRCTRFSSFLIWDSSADAVSRNVFRLPTTALRSSSRVVVGAATAVTASTGVEDTTTGVTSAFTALALGAAFAFTGVSEAAATGATAFALTGATGVAATGASTSFFATRLVVLGVEATADIIPEVEEIELILIRTEHYVCRKQINFYFFLP